MAMVATIPTMPGESPEFPDSFDVIDARVAPGLTNDGQIDWPIPAVLSVNEPPVLPIAGPPIPGAPVPGPPVPVPPSRALIGSVDGSACAIAGSVAAAPRMPAA